MEVQQFTDEKQLALQTFRKDLPRLWLDRPGQFVAYQGDKQLGFAGRKHELYQHCFQEGLTQDEFVIFCIEPEMNEMSLNPVVIDN